MSKTTAITKGVSVSVEVNYQHQHSNKQISEFVFSYKVTIQNLSKSTIQLLRRHWIIFESNGIKREVKGEGVIGEQPRLKTNESFQYTSGTVLDSPLGSMHGSYQMIADNGYGFEAKIPSFTLNTPKILN